MRVQPVLGVVARADAGARVSCRGRSTWCCSRRAGRSTSATRRSELQGLAADASRSNVTVHSFTAEQWAMSASIGRPSPRMGMDSQMLVASVETLAGFTGGKSARLVGTGELALKSLTDGLTGYYRLGVRPAAEDLNGKTRRISVKLSREGASLKGYRRYMAGMRPASETPTVDPATALRNALKKPGRGQRPRSARHGLRDARRRSGRRHAARRHRRATSGAPRPVRRRRSRRSTIGRASRWSSGETTLDIDDAATPHATPDRAGRQARDLHDEAGRARHRGPDRHGRNGASTRAGSRPAPRKRPASCCSAIVPAIARRSRPRDGDDGRAAGGATRPERARRREDERRRSTS